MKNGNTLSMIFAIIALIIFAAAIVGKLALSMDPAVLICAGGACLAGAQIVKKE